MLYSNAVIRVRVDSGERCCVRKARICYCYCVRLRFAADRNFELLTIACCLRFVALLIVCFIAIR